MNWQRIVWWLFIVASLASAYWFMVRPWLARQPALRDVYAFLNEHEAGFFAKARVSMSGLKREMFSRLIWLAGVLVALHDFALPLVGLIDVQPLIPEQYRQYYPFAMAVIGAMFEYLSRISSQPVGQVNPAVMVSATNASAETVAAATVLDPVVAPSVPVPLEAGAA